MRKALVIVGLVGAIAGLAPSDGHGSETTSMASVNSAGMPGNAASGASHFAPALSGDGRQVAFASQASNLVPGDTNGDSDVFVRDFLTGLTTRVSVDSLGRQANRESTLATTSSEGRFVGFQSLASNLVQGDNNSVSDIFVRDLLAETTARISLNSLNGEANGSSQWPSSSADGRFVGFASDASNLVPGDVNNKTDIFVRDRDTDVDGIFDEPDAVATSRVSAGASGEANGDSHAPAISADATTIVFHSFASNLVPGDTNGVADVFVRDLPLGVTSRVSVDSAGVQGSGPSILPVVSGDGDAVAFESLAANLTAGDTNATWDVFVRDRASTSTARVSVGLAGVEGDGVSVLPAISADGNVVSFESYATNLVPGDMNGARDIFVRDRERGLTVRASVGVAGEADGPSFWPAISANGHNVVFSSAATNLVSADGNAVTDVFVRTVEAVCADGFLEDGPVSGPVHELEPVAGPAELRVHEVNCEVIVPLGL